METLPSGAPLPLAVAPQQAQAPVVETPAPVVVETPVVADPPPVPVVVADPPPVTPPVPEPPPAAIPTFEELTGGRFKSAEEIDAVVSKINNPQVQKILEAITDESKIMELSPLFNELSVDYSKLSPIEIIRKGWETSQGRYYTDGGQKEEAFESHLRNEFSVTDPDDIEGNYGISGDGWGKLNERADQYRNQFTSQQSQTRQSLSEALLAVEKPQAPVMTDADIEAHMREYQSVLQSFNPDLSVLAQEVAPLIDAAPSAEWLAQTAKELSEAPNLMLDRYITVENGVPKYNLKQILQDRYILDHYANHVSTAATKSAQLGKGVGAATIVQNLANVGPTTTPSLATNGDPRPKLPSGAPMPIGLKRG
jgi:hypothetical protein